MIQQMDRSLIEEFVEANQPFEVMTASGESFVVPHRDFISFTPKRTAVIISYERDGKERFAVVPLLTVTSVSALAA